MCKENHLTGRPYLMIPDLAIAIVSKEPPSAAVCSSPIVVITDAASPELEMIFVASRAPPNPACYIRSKQTYHWHALFFNYIRRGHWDTNFIKG